jgi:Outer membrane protein and related peptidoglycan-associated (lipo)proteins
MNFKKKSEDEAVIVTNNKDDSIIQIIYFDFDKSNLSNVSINKIKLFLKKYKNKINKFLIVGHTDSKGSKDYNLLLSIERAEVVKKILNENGVDLNNIKILAKGEENLAIMTPDNTKHPANRRVEIKKTN